ncbi:DICT sensory domain-containing protein [Nocardioides hwasunensis]|uniref:MerR family transcriptional regulator n=1 Tax=Nocardioides hwasunensis TaxID=397258 RepID=A0ABR8MMJ0_9ACTN|nr:DICT sensory domain-containing protein [Nocardioides hwasunensis]MBD3916486.1 MerR family transcriptional regulator [Nocardioides hwasunensis]
MAQPGFSIGVLAERTGVTPAVLRSWEHRFGFPVGERSSAGHRRFTDADVAQVRQVLDVRASGVGLRAAIDTVRARHDHADADSVHAVLARQFPQLAVRRLGRRTLLAASHAVEDEALARADRPLVLGSFQEGDRYAASQHRWEELTRTASWAAVVAEFDADLPSDPDARPARCSLPEGSPLRREWTVVTVSPSRAGLVSAWEVPAPAGADPVYEAVVSTDRSAAVAAARVLLGVARSAGASPPGEVDRVLDAPGQPSTAADADRVWLRALAHLEARA